MQWQRCESQQQPQSDASGAQMLDVANARDANVKPYAFRVSAVDLAPCRCGKALHAIIAAAEQDGAKDVDEHVQPCVQVLHAIAVAFKQCTSFRLSRSPHGSGYVDEEDNDSPHCELECAEPPGRR